MSTFVDLMRQCPPPFNMVVYIMLLICGGSVINTIAKQVRKYACHRQEVELKRDLIDRGMTADEIERVVQAGSKTDSQRF